MEGCPRADSWSRLVFSMANLQSKNRKESVHRMQFCVWMWWSDQLRCLYWKGAICQVCLFQRHESGSNYQDVVWVVQINAVWCGLWWIEIKEPMVSKNGMKVGRFCNLVRNRCDSIWSVTLWWVSSFPFIATRHWSQCLSVIEFFGVWGVGKCLRSMSAFENMSWEIPQNSSVVFLVMAIWFCWAFGVRFGDTSRLFSFVWLYWLWSI